MKFHSLMAAILLLLAFDSGAALAQPAAETAAVPAAPEQEAPQAFTYQNGDLVLDIQDSAGGEILRAGLAYFFQDEHIATANEYPVGPVEAIQEQGESPFSAEAQLEAAPLAEPLSVTLFGAGLVLLGWTRRQAASTGNWRQRLVRAFWPWPSISWLDS